MCLLNILYGLVYRGNVGAYTYNRYQAAFFPPLRQASAVCALVHIIISEYRLNELDSALYLYPIFYRTRLMK